MALVASGQQTHHHLIANSRRSFRTFAAAVFSSVSSQFPSSSSSVRSEQKQYLQLQGTNFGTEEEDSTSIAGPSSSLDEDDPQCADWVAGLDRVSDGFARGSEWGSPVWVSPFVSAFIMGGRNPSPRSRQSYCDSGRSSSWGSRKYTQFSRWCLQERETHQGRLHVRELPTIRVWHSSKRFHMGHAHHHQHDHSGKANERILGWGLWSDICLAFGKGGAGYVSGSQALIADAVHSVSDIVGYSLNIFLETCLGKAIISAGSSSSVDVSKALSCVALVTSKVAHAPKDKQHPYGHGKFESLGAVGISGMLLLTGCGIAWHAVETLQPFIPMMSDWVQTTIGHPHEHEHGEGHHHGIDLQHPFVALSAAVVSIGVKEMLFQRTKRIGDEQNSELLKASAWHHRSDAVSSIVALLGIGGAILGMPLLDPVAGFVVSGMIAKAGFETGYQSLQDLVDAGVRESVLSPIRNTVIQVEGVEGCHHLRGRKMGSFIHIDAHIVVDPWLSVSAAHNIAEAVRHQLYRHHPEVTETFVHIEPADGGTKILTPDEAEHEQELHDHCGDSEKHAHIPVSQSNKETFSKTDLTSVGSKSDLMESSHSEMCVDDSYEVDMRQHPGIEQDVRQIVGDHFHEKMSINHVTSHFVQGKVVVEVEVSMNPDISVRNAMDYANEAEQVILQTVSDISKVRVQLKLSKSSSQIV